MRKSFLNFQWGVTSFNVSILNSIRIVLPVSQSGEVDYAFMHAYIQEIEHARIEEMNAYFKVAGFEDCKLTEEEKYALETFALKGFRPVLIGQLFDIKKGKRLTKEDMIPGEINFVGSTASNNGITSRISNTSHIHEGNKITVSYNGSVGEAFYQTDRFWASDDVNVMYFKQKLTECLALYMCTAFKKSGKKYGYAYKWTKELMKGDTIELPVTPSGDVDYHFMEIYIRAQEKIAIQRIKDWRATEISTTNENVEDEQIIQIPIIDTVSDSQKFTTHLPLYTLRAACGYFVDHEEPEIEGWIDVSSAVQHPNKDMFVVHAKGDSMLPKIKDKDLCVFELYHGGSRNDEIVLTQLNEHDSDYGGSYTIKKYHSEKKLVDDVILHTKVELLPLNTDGYTSIELNEETADAFATIAILKCVL